MLEVKCPECGTSFKIGDGNGEVINSQKAKDMNGVAYLIPEDKQLWDKARERAVLNCESSFEDLSKEERQDLIFAEYNKIKENLKGEMKTMATSKKDERMAAFAEMFMEMESTGVDINKFMEEYKKTATPETLQLLDKNYENGYVKTAETHRRHLPAEYVRLLGWFDGARRYDDWTENFKRSYNHDYSMRYLKKELHVLAKLEASKSPEAKKALKEREMFFNKDVVVAVLEDYIERFKNYLLRKRRYNCQGIEYIRFRKNIFPKGVFVNRIDKQIINPLRNIIWLIKRADTYKAMEEYYNSFLSNKIFKFLPYRDQEIHPVFIDAFKGAGAYYALQDFIRFDGVTVNGLNKNESEEILIKKANEYKGLNEWWRLHAFVKQVLKENNFCLREVIEQK